MTQQAHSPSDQLGLWVEGETAPTTCPSIPHRRMKEDRELRCKAIETVLRRAGDRGCSTTEIARLLGFSKSLVHVRLMGDLRQRVYIAGYRSAKGVGKPAARWVWGLGDDAAAPGRDADEVIDAAAAAGRQQALEFKPLRQGLMAAFFGEAG